MTTHLPRPVPVHAVGDELPRRASLVPRVKVLLRSLQVRAGLAVIVLALTVDVLPAAALLVGVLLAAPILVYLFRTTEWM